MEEQKESDHKENKEAPVEQKETKLKPLYFIIPLLVIILIGVLYFALSQKSTKENTGRVEENKSIVEKIITKEPKEPLIKNLPINIAPYDPKTNRAGDIVFTKGKLMFDVMYTDYGFRIPGSDTSNGVDKFNPQPTFYAPLGTKVHSIADGEVVAVGKVWSGDYSIAVAASKDAKLRFETEHVLNPLVKVGDKVKAGDIIAEVSNFDKGTGEGNGAVEFGILIGGNPPKHVCPYLYLDPEAKSSILASLEQLYKDWNAYKGKTIYDTTKYQSIGCITEAEIEG